MATVFSVDLAFKTKNLSGLKTSTTQTEKLDRAAKKAQGSLNGTANGIRQTGRAAKGATAGVHALSGAVKTLLLPLAGFTAVTKFFDGFKEADRARAAVRTLGVDVVDLNQKLLEVSASSGNLASQTELMAAAYDVASAGFVNATDNAAILEASLKGSVGGMSDIATVSDAATSVLNAYGKSASEVGRIIDGFVQTQNAGKITVDQYAKQIGRVAPIASAAGVSIDELNAAIATATAQGVPVEAVFSGLRTGIASILKPSSEATRLAESLGIQFNATALKTKGFGGVLDDVVKKTNGSQEAITKLFGSVEALAAIQPLLNDRLKTYNKNLDDQVTKTGQASDATDEMGGTVSSQLTQIVNGIGNVARALDQVLGPALNGILGQINSIIGAATKALSLLNSANLGAATADLGVAGGQLTFGFESDAVDRLAAGLGKLNPAMAQSKGELKQYTNVVERFNQQLQRVGPNSANYEKVMAAQRQITSLRNQIGGRNGQLERAASQPTLQSNQPPKPVQFENLIDPTTKSSGGGGSAPKAKTDDLGKLQGRIDLAKELAAIDAKRYQAELEGDDQLQRRLEGDKELAKLKYESADAVAALNTEEGKTLQLIYDQQKGLDIMNDTARDLERMDKAKANAIQEALRPLEEQRQILEGTLAGRGEEVRLQLEIDRILRSAPGLERAKVEELVRGNAELEKQKAQAAELENLYKQIGSRVASGLVDGITAAIDGTKSLQEVLSDVLKDVGKMLLQFGIKSAFAGLGIPMMADGGMPQINEPTIVGERGPEMFIPDQPGRVISSEQSKATLGMYSPGNQSASEAAMAPANYSFNTIKIADEDYVSSAQLEKAMNQAAKRGAKEGEAKAMRNLQNNRSTRSRLGF